jgi:hypothetical protein
MLLHNDTVPSIVASGKYAIVAADDMTALDRALTTLHFPHILCNGVWEGQTEQSYLVTNMTENDAVGCGIAFRQDAVIVNGALVACKPPFSRTEFDLTATLYGEIARAQDGYTECGGFVWSLQTRAIRAEWPIVCATAHGVIYRQESGKFAVQHVTHGTAFDLYYGEADRMISTRG